MSKVLDNGMTLNFTEYGFPVSTAEPEKGAASNSNATLARQYGVPSTTQLTKINQFTRRALSAEEVFTFDAKFVGNGPIMNRFIKLDNSLLRKFVDDAKKGIAFMLDHPYASGLFGSPPKPALSYGRSFDSSLRKASEQTGETHAQFGSVYIVRDREKDGLSTNQIIADIEDGVLFDVSIGFQFKTASCSICGNDIRNYAKCEHFPGREYDGELCLVIAKPPGTENELSGVYAGAYETANILSTGGDLASGEEEMRYDEDIKRVKDASVIACMYSANKDQLVTIVKREAIQKSALVQGSKTEGGGLKVDGKNDVTNNDLILTTTGGAPDATAGTTVTAAVATVQAPATTPEVFAAAFSAEEIKAALGADYDKAAVLSYAKEGQQFRRELVAEALEWGVRAHGNEFASESYQQMLSEPTRTIEALKGFVKQFKAEAERTLSAGRTTTPDASSGTDAAAQLSAIPDEAFKA